MRRPGCYRMVVSLAMVVTLAMVIVAPSDRLSADESTGPPPLARLEVAAGVARLPIQIRMNVGSEPAATRFERTRREYVEQLFVRLDRNDDGRLSESEAAAAPSPDLALPGSVSAGEADSVHVAFNFRAVDTSRDGYATLEEFLDFYSYFSDGPFRIRTIRVDGGLLERLHAVLLSALDSDGDGAMAVEELKAAPGLARLDRDGDEVLSPAELLPDASGDERVAVLNASQDFRLRRLRTTDADAIPLALFCPADRNAREPVLMQSGVKSPLPSVGPLQLTHQDITIEVAVAPRPLRVLERTRRVLMLEFDGADADGDGQVARNHRMADYLAGEFERLDSDGDGVVAVQDVRDASRALLLAEAEYRAAQVTFTLMQAGRGLFALLDENRDGRLSRRELSSAQDLMSRFDRNGDARLQSNEMTPPHRLMIARGTLQVPYSTGSVPAAGPAWFSRMDRNRDGDISRGEFLGPTQQFDQLDVDRDGWIDLDEALQVERQVTGTTQDET